MQIYMVRRRASNFFSGLFLLSFFFNVTTNAETTPSTPLSVVMNLSHNGHLDASTLSKAIQDTLGKNDLVAQVELDVSSCEVGNEGMELILQSLTQSAAANDIEGEDDEEKKDEMNLPEQPQLSLHLVARMNRLTPQGVSNLLSKHARKSSAIESDEEAHPEPTDKPVSSGRSLRFKSLDLTWNDLHPHQPGSKAFLGALGTLVGNVEEGLESLVLDQCGLGPSACRALGKGIIKRYNGDKSHKEEKTESRNSPSTSTANVPPLSLHLCGNDNIGDSGTAALAASLRAAIGVSPSTRVLDTLDLSSCGIGDAGAEALALALESYPGCIRNLDLSHNHISNEGAATLAAALVASMDAQVPQKDSLGVLESLRLDNNPDLGDAGAAALAEAMERGVLQRVSLRSCKIKADGAQSFGMAILKLSQKSRFVRSVSIDLSGNPLGVLRGKEKSGPAKYSASALKSKASATTASYMNFIGKKIRDGLKETGLDIAPNSGESDDEAEDEIDENSDDKGDASKARCGAKAFASAIVVGEHFDEDGTESPSAKTLESIACHLSVRRCFLDRGGSDALAASVIQSKERLGLNLIVDARMNPVLEDEMVEALSGEDEGTLEEMSDRHLVALEALYVAEQRAKEAAAAAAARAREESSWHEQDDFGLDFGGAFDDQNDGYDEYDEDY